MSAPLSLSGASLRYGQGWTSTRALSLLLLVTLLCAVPGCAKPPYVWASEVPAERARPEALSKEINPGDTLGVNVAGQAQLSGQFLVSADGTITLPDVGAVAVAGLDQPRATQVLTGRIGQIIREPQVSVVLSIQRIDVSILGEVAAPGKYQVKAGDGVVALIAMAGGLSEFANGDSIYLIRASEPKRVRFRMRDLSRGGTSATAFALRDGDLIVVE